MENRLFPGKRPHKGPGHPFRDDGLRRAAGPHPASAGNKYRIAKKGALHLTALLHFAFYLINRSWPFRTHNLRSPRPVHQAAFTPLFP